MTPPTWDTLLIDAVQTPGTLAAAYSRFHNYSFGNQLLALFQCAGLGLEPGPIATFNKWTELGRKVKKGEKALTLCMPRPFKKEKDGEEVTFVTFIYRNLWFVLGQTEGEPYSPPPSPEWSYEKALSTLNIMELPFKLLGGNTLGYAMGGNIHINPVVPADHVWDTRIHEIAHVLLHQKDEELIEDSKSLTRNLKEVEAEATSLIILETLGLGETNESRGYIQHWLKDEVIPEKSAQRIFKAADKILKAGKS